MDPWFEKIIMQDKNPMPITLCEAHAKPKITIKIGPQTMHPLNEIFYPNQSKNPFDNDDDDSLVDQDDIKMTIALTMRSLHANFP